MAVMKKAMRKSSGMKKAAQKSTMKKSSMKRTKKAKKVSVVGKGKMAKSQVFKGRKVRTSGGLKKSDLTKNKFGKVVSKKKSQIAKTGKAAKWITAVIKARKDLGIKGFCAVGGKDQKGRQLLAKARSFYKK